MQDAISKVLQNSATLKIVKVSFALRPESFTL
jgi:hypothetical protein